MSSRDYLSEKDKLLTYQLLLSLKDLTFLKERILASQHYKLQTLSTINGRTTKAFIHHLHEVQLLELYEKLCIVIFYYRKLF